MDLRLQEQKENLVADAARSLLGDTCPGLKFCLAVVERLALEGMDFLSVEVSMVSHHLLQGWLL